MTNRSKLQETNFKAGNTDILKRGLVKEMGDFAAKRSAVNYEAFVEAFCGRQFRGVKVTQHQIRRHLSWMKSHGVLKAAATARSAKAGA